MTTVPSFATRNYVFILAAVAALNNCNLGYDMGIVSSVGIILLEQTEFPVSEVQVELFIGALDVSSLLGAAASNYLADMFGRKACMAFSEILFIVSVVGMACAQNYATLASFRCVCGVGVGLGLTIGPLYIGELAPSSLRGKLVSWSEIATNIGLLTAFIIGAAFAGLPINTSWRVMLGLGSLLPTVLLCCLHFMPESPRWLIATGKVDEAKRVLQRLHPEATPEHISDCVAEIQTAIEADQITYITGGWHAIFHPTAAVSRALTAALGIAAIQQLSGIEAVTSYFVFIFTRAGLHASGSYVFLILFGVCKLLTVYIASRGFDNPHCGRRPLLLVSGVGVCLCMIVFAMVFSFPISQASTVVTVVAMFAYVIFYSVGYGPGAWIVMLEVLPMHIRAKGLSLCTFLNRAIASVLSGSFLTLVRYMRYAGYFWLFAALTLGCVAYVYALIPETQGKTLESMAEVFQCKYGDDKELGGDTDVTASCGGGSGGGGAGSGSSGGGEGNGEVYMRDISVHGAVAAAVGAVAGAGLDEETKVDPWADDTVEIGLVPIDMHGEAAHTQQQQQQQPQHQHQQGSAAPSQTVVAPFHRNRYSVSGGNSSHGSGGVHRGRYLFLEGVTREHPSEGTHEI